MSDLRYGPGPTHGFKFGENECRYMPTAAEHAQHCRDNAKSLAACVARFGGFGGPAPARASSTARFDGKTPGPKSVPAAACRFELEQAVFAAEKDAQGIHRFKGKVNSGQVIKNHWFWGNLAIDMAGLKINRQDLPILRDHDSREILGHTTTVTKSDKGIEADGRLFSITEPQKEVTGMLALGMPFQMSCWLPPSKVQWLDAGETAMCNGHTVEGPGAILRETTLREVTVTALGADENTSAALLSDSGTVIVDSYREQEPGQEMSDTDKSASKGAGDAASSAALAADEARKTERARVLAIQKMAADGDIGATMLELAINEGWTKEQAATKFFGYMSERKEARLAAIKDGTPGPSGTAAPKDRSGVTELSDKAVEGAGEKLGAPNDKTAQEKAWRDEFARKPELREEFVDNVEEYVAFMKNEGNKTARRSR